MTIHTYMKAGAAALVGAQSLSGCISLITGSPAVT